MLTSARGAGKVPVTLAGWDQQGPDGLPSMGRLSPGAPRPILVTWPLMTRDRSTGAIGFGSGTSSDHKDGIRWVDYANISWNPVFCKRCDICVDICPKDTLVLRNDAIIEEENCILCGLCERYCPDLAIEMIPAAVAAHAAKE
jgi:2-oxoglutarate ferredoxin oxidoreductase subunit delta